MALVMTDSQKAGLSIQPIDIKGNPAEVDGIPSWSVSSDTLLSLVVAADGLSADVVAVGPLGTAQVNVTADADLGEGIVEVVGLLEVTIVGGQAVSMEITAGTPIEQ